MIQDEDGRFKILACVDFRISCRGTGKSSFQPRFRKSQTKTLKETSRNFCSFILVFDWLKVRSFQKKMCSVNFKTSHNDLRKQRWTFRQLCNFHLILASKEKVRTCTAKNQVDFIYNWFNLNKNKIDIYQEVLRDVSQNFENAKFIEMVQQFGVSKSTIIFKRSLLIITLR